MLVAISLSPIGRCACGALDAARGNSRWTGRARCRMSLQHSQTTSDGVDGCADGLFRIASDYVFQNLAERYGESESPDFRSMGTRILEGIRSDRAVETGLELFANETDDSLRECLADSLLFQFDSRAIEPVRM